MDAPPVQYVRTKDGVNIAFADVGEGRPLVWTPIAWNHLQYEWQIPTMREWWQLLTSRFRVVRLDWRGQGMSSRGLGLDLKLEDWLLDIEAVVDKLALERFILIGMGAHAHLGIRYAALHPERVAALILLGSAAKSDAWPPGIFQNLVEEDWDLFLRLALPSRNLSPEEMHLTIERMKRTIDRQDFIIRTQALYESKNDEILPLVTAPTLVLHHRDNKVPSVEEGMKLAASLRRSRFVLLEGDELFMDAEAAVAAIGRFVTELGERTDDPVTEKLPETGLTSRELEVLRLISAGRSNPQIADELVISLNTVQRHVSNILAKTGAANRTEAAGYARDRGLA